MFTGIVAKAADGASRDAGLWADLKGQNHLCSDDFVEAMQVRVPRYPGDHRRRCSMICKARKKALPVTRVVAPARFRNASTARP